MKKLSKVISLFVVSGLLGGIGSIPKYAAKKGIAAAKAMLSRAAVAAAKRAVVYAGIVPRMFNIINIYRICCCKSHRC